MKHYILALSMALLFGATASATVTYSTNGVFNCTNGDFADGVSGTDSISGCAAGGSNSITLNDGGGGSGNESITLTFINLTNQSLNASSGTFANYGSIQATCAGAGCGSSAQVITLTGGLLSIALSISESVPDSSPNHSAGTAGVTGGIANDSSTLTVGSYSGSPVTITGLTDTVIYTINTSDTLFAPTNGATPGRSGLGMTITDTAVVSSETPEPATLALFGAGLVGLGFARRRKQA